MRATFGSGSRFDAVVSIILWSILAAACSGSRCSRYGAGCCCGGSARRRPMSMFG